MIATPTSPDAPASVVRTPGTPSAPPTTTAITTRPGPAELAALVTAVQAEQSAVYGYGIVGGQTRSDRRSMVRARLAWHAARRDEVAARLSAAGHKVPAGSAAYDLPFEVNSDETARRLAAHLEAGVAAAWAELVAVAAGQDRITAAQSLSSCATSAWQWGAALSAFPGLPERSNGT